MRKYAAWPAAALLVMGAATGAWAQQKGKGAAPQQPVECDLKTSHFAVSRAVLYIQNASSAQDSIKRQQALDGAHRSLVEALEQGQESNPAVWYFLGVYYALEADAAGADSAFDRVEAMMPSCEKDIEQYRYTAWAGATNQGIDAMRENKYDKAKGAFALANRVYSKKPTALFYLGTLFATEDNADSALHYFKAAAKAAQGDTAETEILEKSTQNVARIYQVLETWDSAQVWFKAYLQLHPEDLDAQTNLANAYLAGGDTASAVKIYDDLLAKAETMDAMDVCRIGVQLFRSEHADKATVAFEKCVARSPYYRNGLYNLTNSYFSLAQATQKPDSVKYWAGKMLPVSQRLAQVDPYNRQVLRLIAAAHQFVGNGDSTDAVLKKVNDMKFEVDVPVSRATDNGYEVQGTITALKPGVAQTMQDSITRDSTQIETLKHTNVPAAQKAQLQRRQATLQARVNRLRGALLKLNGPVNVPPVVFEFLDKDGNVAATETVAVQAVEPGSVKQFQLTPSTKGIVAWRYKAGSAP